MNFNKLKNVRLLLLDVDGVLTDGRILYTDSGEQVKTFNSKDGLGLRLLMDAGIKVGIITGRKSNALVHRCRNLKIDLVMDGVKNKAAALAEICLKTGIRCENIAFMGDDLIDLPIMKHVGIAVSVSDAAPEVKNHADIITLHKGGRGAVREICEQILDAKDLWEDIVNRFIK